MIRPSSVSAVTVRSSGRLVAFDDQRMIARRLERCVDAAENAGAGMADRRELAVHRRGRAHHLAAEGIADRLMAEADAEDRDLAGSRGDEIEADAGLFGRARAGGEHNGVGIGGNDGGAVILSLRCTRTCAPSSPR